ncbi:MAG: hypothetical protein B7Z73_05675, partial [Planctomycetia bacterium 21-64-5]
RGTVARSTNRGASWTIDSVPGANTLDLRSIVGLSARVAVAASAGPAEKGQARIFRTADGGRTWTTTYTTDRKGVFLDALAFWDAQHGIALSDPVDGTLFLLTTDDGGQTWTRVPPGALPPTLGGEGAFAASNTSIALWGSRDVWIGTGGGAVARVFYSTDRGHTWAVSDTPVHSGSSASGVFAVAFRDARHGVWRDGDRKLAFLGPRDDAHIRPVHPDLCRPFTWISARRDFHGCAPRRACGKQEFHVRRRGVGKMSQQGHRKKGGARPDLQFAIRNLQFAIPPHAMSSPIGVGSLTRCVGRPCGV